MCVWGGTRELLTLTHVASCKVPGPGHRGTTRRRAGPSVSKVLNDESERDSVPSLASVLWSHAVSCDVQKHKIDTAPLRECARGVGCARGGRVQGGIPICMHGVWICVCVGRWEVEWVCVCACVCVHMVQHAILIRHGAGRRWHLPDDTSPG